MRLNVGGIEDVFVEYLAVSLVRTLKTEHNGTALQGHLATIVLGIVVGHNATHVHGEVEFDDIALLPTALDGGIAVGFCGHLYAIHCNGVDRGCIVIFVERVISRRSLQP